MSSLVVRQLAAGYGDVRAVWDVSLDVHEGEVAVVFGRNGAGKTTTVMTIAGLLKADRGTVELDGRDITNLPAHRRVGLGLALVQEGKRIFRQRTVEENLQIGGQALSRRVLNESLRRQYELFPVLAEKRRLLAGSLSGGQQQMLAIGQALMPGPRLVMLDEPSAGLAPSIVKQVMEVVLTLKREGIGVLLIEQLVSQALAIADHVTVLDRGRIVHTATAADALNNGVIEDLYLGRVQSRID